LTNGSGYRHTQWSEDKGEYKVDEKAQNKSTYTKLFVTVFENGPSIYLKIANLVNHNIRVSNYWAFTVALSVFMFVSKLTDFIIMIFDHEFNSFKAIAAVVGMQVLVAALLFTPLIPIMGEHRTFDGEKSH